MDRNTEYWALIAQLDDTPAALEDTVARARRRHKRASARKWLGLPVATLGGLAAAFVLLVNTSIPFALACAQVPFLKDLTAAVSFSPSLRAAVEHNYVQYIGQSQSVDGVTLTLEYIIGDDRQLNLFYRTDGAHDRVLTPTLVGADGNELTDMSMSWEAADSEDSLRHVTADFMSNRVPQNLTFGLKLENPERIFAIDFTVDPRLTGNGTTLVLDRPITLDGQSITVHSVEIYPTHLRLNLVDDPDNTAWLRDIEFYVTDENGAEYAPISNGISATGDPSGTPFMPSHRLESTYFGSANHLTLHITGATWLDKDAAYADIDLVASTATGLPQGAALSSVLRVGETIQLTIQNPTTGMLFTWDYWDPDGGQHTWDSMGSTSNGEGKRREDLLTLESYPYDTVRLGLSYTRIVPLPTPITLPLK